MARLATQVKNRLHAVLPGNGQLPLVESIAILHASGYHNGKQFASGWLQFEREKRWHPTLLEPEVAFPAFIAGARKLATSLRCSFL